jgi:hypothetical protein
MAVATEITIAPVVFDSTDVMVPAGESGVHTFMYRGAGLDMLRTAFKRDNIAAKIHYNPLYPGEQLSEYIWGVYYSPAGEQSRLKEACAIQNIASMRHLAPRVYGWALWRDKHGQLHPVQITEDRGKCDWGQSRDNVREIYLALKKLGNELGWQVPGADAGVQNVVHGAWVDFQGFQFTPDYETKMIDRFWLGTQWGDRPYQQAVDTPVTRNTCRNINHRISDLGLSALDFTPQHVLDIGCSGGQFLNYLTSHYGARGTGYDTERATLAAAEYSAYFGYWNVDYIVADLSNPHAVQTRADLVLFLSMSRHVGLPEYVKRAATKRLIIEAHEEHNQQVEAWLGSEFEIVRTHISTDYGRRVFHAERKPA